MSARISADESRLLALRMADNERYVLNPQLGSIRVDELCEQCDMFMDDGVSEWNGGKNNFSFEDIAGRPGGSLFLFDRKALRYFRRDGHRWRKKKDGKTVREAHEKLKSGSVDVLHCYYAHGEENENFQRRSYWMLEGQLEHIVLVHYREVKEGHRSGSFCSLNTDQGTVGHTGGAQSSSVPCSAKANPSVSTAQLSYASTPGTAYWNGQSRSSEPEDLDAGEDYGVSALSGPASCSGFEISSLHVDGSTDKNTSREGLSEYLIGGASFKHDVYSSSQSDRSTAVRPEEKLLLGNKNGADFMIRKLTDSITDPSMHIGNNAQEEPHGNIMTSKQSLDNSVQSSLCDGEGSLKKLDSFGRWMNKEIGKDCDDSLMASDSCNYWNEVNPENDEKEVSGLSRHMQLDTDSLGPFLSQEQLFSILDFSPGWSYSRVKTKVLITGTFLGGLEHPISRNWCCMFGEIEVSAEVLTNNTLRCQAPAHVPGVVPFYITCSNRLACSEVRDFEYREKPPGPSYSIAVKNDPQEEMCLQIRLAKMLFLGADKKRLDCSAQQCEKCRVNRDLLSMKARERSDWFLVDKAARSLEDKLKKPRDALIQMLLKDRLYDWLVCRTHEEGKGPNVLDDDGQGIIHLAAALGYDWAMGPIVAAGVNPSFRDARGRTGLHWAAYFGREETVVSLVSLGAAPGAVEDPKSSFPEGRTAADLASSRGHKGIAGYLAEADLTSHLSSLTLKEGVVDDYSATLASEKAIEKVEKQTIISLDGNMDCASLRRSLAAMRNSAQAAARIQAAFRVYSFRQRQLKEWSNGSPEITTELVALAILGNKPRKLSESNKNIVVGKGKRNF
ncbi:hypothetical protein ACLOJK_021989 [Asimina triloba]